MKRILTVLVLLAVCGLAYSVTGKVFTQFGTTGVSLGDTGTDMNFDGFTFTYKLSDPLAATASPFTAADALAGTGVAPLSFLQGGATATAATTPGYFQVSGVKLSDAMTVALGMKWYTLGASTTVGTSNLTTADTNNVIGFNSVFFEPKVVYTVNDTTTLTMDWNNDGSTFGKAIQVAFYGGSSSVKNSGQTNNYSVSGFQFGIPAKINTKVGDLAIEAYPDFVMASESMSSTTTAVTNTISKSITHFGAYLQGTYPLNDTMKIQGKVSLDSKSTVWNQSVTNQTNNTTVTKMPLGLFGEVIWAVAPQTTVNLGLGYKVPLSDVTVVKTTSATNTATTTLYGLQGYDPIISFGGSTKFAENWTLGINGRMTYVPAQTAANNQNTGGTNFTASDEAVKFNNTGYNASDGNVNWDLGDNAKSMFIQYDIDAVSIRFAITSAGQGVFNAGRLNLSYTY